MSAVAGWNATAKVGGTPTAVAGEACTLVVGTTYQINTAAKRVWDPSVIPVVKDGGVPTTTTSIDYHTGKVTLTGAPGGAVTVDVTYIPLLSVAQGKALGVSIEVGTYDASVFGARDRVFLVGLRTLTASLGTLDTLLTDLDAGLDTWKWSTKQNGTAIFVELDPTGAATHRYRFWAFITKADVKSAVDALVTGDLELQATAIAAADGSIVTFSCG